jgi:hypothetical protein
MAAITPENEKEKSGTPGFFNGIRKSILNIISPNQSKRHKKGKYKQKRIRAVIRKKIATKEKKIVTKETKIVTKETSVRNKKTKRRMRREKKTITLTENPRKKFMNQF